MLITQGEKVRSSAAIALAFVATFVLACGGRINRTEPEPVVLADSVLGAAQPGDSVVLVRYVIKAGERPRFEQFLSESYWPAIRKLASTDVIAARMLARVRVLTPARTPDGAVSEFVFVMDAEMARTSHQPSDLMSRAFPAAEAQARYAMFRDTVRDRSPAVYLMTRGATTPITKP